MHDAGLMCPWDLLFIASMLTGLWVKWQQAASNWDWNPAQVLISEICVPLPLYCHSLSYHGFLVILMSICLWYVGVRWFYLTIRSINYWQKNILHTFFFIILYQNVLLNILQFKFFFFFFPFRFLKWKGGAVMLQTCWELD